MQVFQKAREENVCVWMHSISICYSTNETYTYSNLCLPTLMDICLCLGCHGKIIYNVFMHTMHLPVWLCASIRIRLRKAQVWVCGRNQASIPSADSSLYALCLKSASLPGANILLLLGHTAVFGDFQALLEITTKILSLPNRKGTVTHNWPIIQLVFFSLRFFQV